MCAEGLGCNQADSVNTQIKCLQELPVDDIVASGITVGFRGAQAVVDGSFSDEPFLPDHPKSLMSSGMYNKNVNILLGSNRLINKTTRIILRICLNGKISHAKLNY